MHNSFGKTSHRLLRVNELIKRELSEIMQHLDWSETGLPNLTLTLTEGNCSKDIRIARVYYVPVGRENSKQYLSDNNEMREEVVTKVKSFMGIEEASEENDKSQNSKN